MADSELAKLFREAHSNLDRMRTMAVEADVSEEVRAHMYDRIDHWEREMAELAPVH